jgi:menaquinone-9 beta-reductase
VTDVAVVGAGPAGASAAITLARAGRTVTLIDRARFPRDKCCGDGLTTSALRELEHLGLDPSSVGSWNEVHGARLWSPSGYEVDLPLPRDAGVFAVIARRVDLDAALLDVARKEGATVIDGVGCRSVSQLTDRVALELSDGSHIEARYVVAADGAWSPMRRMLGLQLPGYRGDWHAFRQYFADVASPAADELLVWFEPDFLPGYAWSFPLGDGRANVGFGISRNGSFDVGDMGKLWRELLARPHIRDALGPDARPEASPRAWPIPARVDQVILGSQRVVFAGDAAAATDLLTGEGIGQALLTGRWAAEAIVAAGAADPASLQRRYRRRVEQHLVPDHRMSALLVRAVRHRKGARAAIALAGLTPWTRRNFARWLFEDYPRALVVTPRRWRRGMFTRPGAFLRGSTPGNAPATSDR